MSSNIGTTRNTDFAVTDQRILHQFIREHPLGTLTTHLPNNAQLHRPLLQATQIRFVLDVPNDESTPTNIHEHGVLSGHMAITKPHAKSLQDAFLLQKPSNETDERHKRTLEQEVMVTFTSPQAYVTPAFYTHKKPRDGMTVPNRFFGVVQVYGVLTLHLPDSELRRKHLEDMTPHAEERLMRYPADEMWNVGAAPGTFNDTLRNRTIGLEIRITNIEGKQKPGR